MRGASRGRPFRIVSRSTQLPVTKRRPHTHLSHRRAQVRSELTRELQQRLTDLFWKLSSGVIKSLIQHKADVTSLDPQRSASQKRLSLAEVGRGRSSSEDSLVAVDG
jgi:hypothetical protein